MECQCRSSQKHLLLQVWCALLTVAMVTMAAYLSSIKPKPAEDSNSCDSCVLVLRDDSIHCTAKGLYFLYAQVTFNKYPKTRRDMSVIIIQNAQFGKSERTLVEGSYPKTMGGSVWVANVVNLSQGDSISINITGDFLSDNTYWGAFQLQ
ncbi:lymphotoxin-alpha [Brachionichthys hirsutus]|uniref:lymphotoxin-alpha n=1 Tax=Brachionichthys hirsutus TaxID=412623 RepID=UPI003604ADE8